MAKNILIAGDFDCINTRHLHIIKEAKKLAIPNGRVVVLLFADYTKFLVDKVFPIQQIPTRRKNLEYFIKPEDIIEVDTSDYENFLDNKLSNLKDFTYMHYETDKEFIGRWSLRKHSVPVKFIKEPIIHKHSQSDGRLTFSKENQELLDKKWPNDKVISLLGLDNDVKKLRILLANNHLDNFAGSETWTYTMAKHIESLGHDVSVYTRAKGKVSAMLNTVDVVADEYDLLIINHNTCLKDLENVKGYKIFTSHGIYPQLEQPIAGADAYVSISPEVQAHLKRKGFDSKLIYNGVDMERFCSTRELNEKPKTILSLCKGDEANELVSNFCSIFGFNFIQAQDKFNVEEAINRADIVITLGRGAVEAMSCGREVIVLDSRAYMKMGIVGDGMIRPENAIEIMKHNYSGRTKNINFDIHSLDNEVKKYDKNKAALNRMHVARFHDIKISFNRYLSLYDNRNN